MASGSRARIEAVSSDLLARRGYNGMGLKAVSEAADLPFGSIYHHFPGGKEEIAAAAIAGTGATVEELLRAVFADGVDAAGLRAMFTFMSAQLSRSGWSKGCPIGTPAQDGAAESDLVREACATALAQVVKVLADALVRDGLRRKAAQDLAVTIVAAYEGATMLARVQRSEAPMTATCDAMVRLVRTSLG
jgi:TetR/AcrR family transcriptional repressor of lmrAB and yxaGH operons